MMKKILLFLSILVTFGSSCNRGTESAFLTIKLSFAFNGEELLFDGHEYVTAAGDHITFDEIKFFISELSLRETIKQEKTSPLYNGPDEVHYFDSQIASTLTWEVKKPFEVKHYDLITMMLGIAEERNITGMFTNPPEVNMAWPETLGGGYHHLQINGKWDNGGVITPFNIHTGKCAIRDEIGQFVRFINFDTPVRVPFPGYYYFRDDTREIHLV
ncbi:MAG: hypothetical protein LBV46_02785, partial [Bacteroidales bacterium]|nr:hypothetical protein [Bacteroidales bacterium]